MLAYLALICTFSQSYSFAVLGKDPTFHFAPLLALIGAGGIEAVLLNVFTARLGIIGVGIGVGGGALILSLLLGVSLKERFFVEEEAIRIVPTTWVCNSVPANGIVISSKPILIASICDPHQVVLDYSQIGRAISQGSLNSTVATDQVYLFWSSVDSAADAQRFPDAARFLVTFQQEAVADLSLGEKRYRLSRLEVVFDFE